MNGAPPYLFENYEPHEVLTANGRTLTIDHQGMYRTCSISLVEEHGLPVHHDGGRSPS